MLAYFENISSGKLFDHFSRYGYIANCREQADVCISINEAKGQLPAGKIVALQGNQKFQLDNGAYVFSVQSSVAGCVWGRAYAPFFDIQIFCDFPETGCGFKAMQDIVLQFYRYRCLYLKKLLIHASTIVKDGVSIAFSGASGEGKSTQANLWRKYKNAYMLNDDKPILSLSNDHVFISGSPWSGKGNCYLNETHELKGLLFLGKAKQNCLQKLTLREIYAYLYLNNMPCFINDEIQELYADLINQYCGKISAYLLKCTPDERAVNLVYDTILMEGNE